MAKSHRLMLKIEAFPSTFSHPLFSHPSHPSPLPGFFQVLQEEHLDAKDAARVAEALDGIGGHLLGQFLWRVLAKDPLETVVDLEKPRHLWACRGGSNGKSMENLWKIHINGENLWKINGYGWFFVGTFMVPSLNGLVEGKI